jgi:single-stranded-DNA-specific exonuclease
MYDWEILSDCKTLEQLENFLLTSRSGNLTISEFYNPPHPKDFISENYFGIDFLKNLKLAKQKILESISNGDLILIHGDYDADGVCATTIMFDTITKVLNYNNCGYIIPDRFEDGYGLSDKTVQKLLDLSFNKPFLLITVDCGITAIKQIEDLRKLNCRVIVTDHHHKSDTLPDCEAIVWSDKVVGSTLAWILSLGLGNKNPLYLGLVTIATITDVFPLKDINRAIIKHGLEVIRKKPFNPIDKLIESINKKKEEIDTVDLGFGIGPRLNSSGRIGSADIAVEMLTSLDEMKVSECVKIINSNNIERQRITSESLEKFQIDENNIPEIIISFDKNYHEGVMGLIASKILQKYHRPTLVVSEGHGVLKGSARSLDGVNIVELLSKISDIFKSYGGHAQAAGFSLLPENFDKLKGRILTEFKKEYSNFNFKKKLKVDSLLDVNLLNFDLFKILSKIEPFGTGNYEPIFCSEGFSITEIKFVGVEKNHLSLKLSKDGTPFKAIFFSFPKNNISEVYLGQKVDLVYKISSNEFNGKRSLDLHLLDLRPHETK